MSYLWAPVFWGGNAIVVCFLNPSMCTVAARMSGVPAHLPDYYLHSVKTKCVF